MGSVARIYSVSFGIPKNNSYRTNTIPNRNADTMAPNASIKKSFFGFASSFLVSCLQINCSDFSMYSLEIKTKRSSNSKFTSIRIVKVIASKMKINSKDFKNISYSKAIFPIHFIIWSY